MQNFWLLLTVAFSMLMNFPFWAKKSINEYYLKATRGGRICSYLLFIVRESSALKRHKEKAWIGPNEIIRSPRLTKPSLFSRSTNIVKCQNALVARALFCYRMSRSALFFTLCRRVLMSQGIGLCCRWRWALYDICVNCIYLTAFPLCALPMELVSQKSRLQAPACD